MKKVLRFFKKEWMLALSLAAAVAGLILTPMTAQRFLQIDWRTLGTLFMMLCVLEGFKQENVLQPLADLALRLRHMTSLTLFLVFGVFFSSMFVTNDVSLMIFVPLTILLFRQIGQERYILPVISMQNIAAVRGSLLTPFGSPQNLFLFGQIDVGVGRFMLRMLPLCVMSAALLVVFVFVLYRKARHSTVTPQAKSSALPPERRVQRVTYLVLFALVLAVIVTRTRFWPVALAVVPAVILVIDRKLFLKVDYALLVTFLCFFIFSSSVAGNETVAAFLRRSVAGREYWWAIGLSQIISNVPATIVLFPFSVNRDALIYGADTAGLCSLIGSLASVINYRIYVRAYPQSGGKFLRTFTLVSWAFFVIVVIPGYLLSRSRIF